MLNLFLWVQFYKTRNFTDSGNYIREKDSTIDMTEFMNKNYKEVADKMKSMLWE